MWLLPARLRSLGPGGMSIRPLVLAASGRAEDLLY